MADDLTLTDAERDAILEARKAAAPERKVRVKGVHEGTEYEFELEGDEAQRVIDRHKALFAPDPPKTDDGKKPPRPTLIPRQAKTG